MVFRRFLRWGMGGFAVAKEVFGKEARVLAAKMA